MKSNVLRATWGRAVTEAVALVPMRESYQDPDAGHSDFAYYRKIGAAGRRDLPEVTRRAAVERAFRFLHYHPLGARAASLMLEWIDPLGFKVKAADTTGKVQEICDEHVTDPRNAWLSGATPFLPMLSDVKTAVGLMTGSGSSGKSRSRVETG